MTRMLFLSLGLLLLLGAGCSLTRPTPPIEGNRSGMMGSSHGASSDDAMREHCKMMPGMRGCEKYRDENSVVVSASNGFDRSTSGLSDAKPQEVVSLNNGDDYSLSADFVKKEISGKTIRMLAYNGELSGPILRVKQGDSINIDFKNNLDQPTTVHWHGVRVDNANDGVPNVTQPQVDSGQAYKYTLKFPDAGLYWYHPHMREDYQQELGMYGLIWVEPSDATIFEPVNQTAFLTLDDILLGENDVAPFDTERVNHTLMGRFGNTMLVNGQTNYSLRVNKGDVVRFAAVNTANTRIFKLGIPGTKMKLVGGDSGAYSHDQWVESVTLAPSERALIDVQFSKVGTFDLKHLGPDIQYTLGKIAVSDSSTQQNYSATFAKLQDRSTQFVGLESYYAKTPDKELDLTINMPGMMGNMQMNGMMMNHGVSNDGIEWEDSMAIMNQNSNDKSLNWRIRDKETGLENDKIDYEFKQGEKVKIRIFNDGNSMHPMQHPIHFHGNRFIVLAINGVKNTNPVWKDTVLVPVGAKADILLDASNPGTWMAHCHIAEHLHDGMMFAYKVR